MYKITLFFAFILFTIISCSKSNTSDCEAKLINDCFHTLEYNPVCGCNEVTYGNPGEAACNSITEYTYGRCKYDHTDIVGEWEFIGYEIEGATFKSAKKTHKYPHMGINFTSEKLDNDRYNLSGRSSINFISGNYDKVQKDQLQIDGFLSTKIGGSEEDLRYETLFTDNLVATTKYKTEDGFLELETIIFSNDGTSLDSKSNKMFFKKK